MFYGCECAPLTQFHVGLICKACMCCKFFIHVSVAANSKPGDGRSTFFEDHLKRLADAPASGFDTLKQACKLTKSLVDDVYPSITTNSS